MFPMATSQLLDFSSLLPDSVSSAAMTPEHFPTEYAEHNPWVLGSLFSTDHNNDIADRWAVRVRNGEGDCNCHAGVTELLASMRGGGNNEQRLSIDAQLAKLKRCIVSSETSMECAHGRQTSEPIHIMAIAMLIGYVMEDFKMLASDSSLCMPSSSSSSSLSPPAINEMAAMGNTGTGTTSMSGMLPNISSTDMSMGGCLEPRLSWGVLELEDDDEKDLRQRLYLLSFRKLERLLTQLTQYLRDLHNARANLPDPSRHMAFIIACDYTRLWLEKKADDVKRLLSFPARDEATDLAFAHR
ncbi:hypothetical protein N0V90_012542 [Kalmusia sp. IMI 367209]|nr:hypothetical protein N0V90_012542 [Kalmusia sp. IMI 367209]